MIIKATDVGSDSRPASISTAELAALGGTTRDEGLQCEAARLIAEAKQEAERIRREAAEQGRIEGERAARKETTLAQEKQWTAVLAVVDGLVTEINGAKQAWKEHWEQTAIGLAIAISERILRRELTDRPQISLELVRETLELATGGDQVRILLSPNDYRTLGNHVTDLAQTIGTLGTVEVVADASIDVGGCRVETQFGSIDQQVETQLRRIEEELKN